MTDQSLGSGARTVDTDGRAGGSGVGTITGAKVFSATRAKEREELGETITRWLRANPQFEIVDKIVTQSSDREFHCLTVTIFYRERVAQAG
jgi:hypothetical protein